MNTKTYSKKAFGHFLALALVLTVMLSASAFAQSVAEDLEEAAEEEIIEEVEEIEPPPVDIRLDDVSSVKSAKTKGKHGLSFILAVANESDGPQDIALEFLCTNRNGKSEEFSDGTIFEDVSTDGAKLKHFLPLPASILKSRKPLKLACEADITLLLDGEAVEDDNEENNTFSFQVVTKGKKLMIAR